LVDTSTPITVPSSVESTGSGIEIAAHTHSSSSSIRGTSRLGAANRATVAPEGRQVHLEEASRWASTQGIPVSVEVSALSGEQIEEVFSRLASTILTKIELGEINPDDPLSGIQYGDSTGWAGPSDGGSIKSVMSLDDGTTMSRRRNGHRGPRRGGLRDWENVFRLNGRQLNRCC